MLKCVSVGSNSIVYLVKGILYLHLVKLRLNLDRFMYIWMTYSY